MVIAIIVSFLIPGIIVALRASAFNPIRKRILKLKEEKARNKRLRDGAFIPLDVMRIKDKDESELKDYELRAIKKAEQELKELNRSRNEEMHIILDSIKMIILIRISRPHIIPPFALYHALHMLAHPCSDRCFSGLSVRK